jgi:hypothetical protein
MALAVPSVRDRFLDVAGERTEDDSDVTLALQPQSARQADL